MTQDRGFGRGQHPEELLSAAVSGDLTGAERAAVDAHLLGCDRCRATLQAFSEERRLIGGMRHVAPPRDLGARVRAGIEGRRAPADPWWRRPGTLVAAFASLTTIAAALLAVVVFSDVQRGPTGATGEASASVSASASATQTASLTPPPTTNPSVEGTPTPKPSAPTTALETGQVGYLQVDGQPQREIRLSFVNDATGTLTRLGPTGGPPVVAALSPTNEFLAYAVDLGLSGARQVRVTRLSDGATTVLGCTVPRAFADRLAWSDDGRWLAYTLTPIDLGGSVDCGGVTGDGTRSDVWVYDAVATGEAIALTRAGNAFAADFIASNQQDGEYPVLISYAGEEPYTEAYSFITDRPQPRRVEGVFLPLMSADGTRALFWRGRMEQVADGGWHFVDGGLPYLSGEPVDGQPSWSGEPLFADLEPVGGAAFESGQFGWSPDGMLVGFWLGEWTGAPQSGDGSYPSPRDVYVGRAGDLLSAQSRVPLELQEQQRVVDVALDGESETALVTVVQPSAGDLAVPASTLYRVPVAGGEPAILGTAASWTGPAVIGLEAVADTR